MKNKFLSIIILFLFTIQISAQLDRSIQPKSGPAPEIKIGDYQSFILDNGLKVFVVENNKLPKITVQFLLKRDPILEGKNAGYVKIAGDLLRRGTAKRTKDQLDEDIDFIGAYLGTSSTSVTGSCLSKHRERFFEIFSDVLLNPNFKQEELDKIKKQMLSALESKKDDPGKIASGVRNAVVYGKNNPYGEMVTKETINSITLEMCKNYYNIYFKPNIAYLIVLGDIEKDDVEDLVKKYLADWKQGTVPTTIFKVPEAPVVTTINVVDRPNAVQSVINVSYPINLKPGDKDIIPASILNMILGGSFSSRLNQSLREKHAWTYGAHSSISDDEYVGNVLAYSEVRTAVTDSAVGEFLNQMEIIRKNKISEEELKDTKNLLVGNFSRSLENPGMIASFALNIAMYNLPKDYYKNYLKNLTAVTVDDLQRVAKKYITPKSANVIVVGNTEVFAKGLKKYNPGGKVTYYDAFANKYDPSVTKVPKDMNAEKVIENYLKAIGGKELILNLKSVKMDMKGEVQGMTIYSTAFRKAPNKMKTKFEIVGIQKQEVIFDGEKGKTIVMGQETSFEKEQLEEMKLGSVINLEARYKEFGIKATLGGIEKIDGKDAYRVKIEYPTGSIFTQYFDTKTFLKIQQVTTIPSPQGEIVQKTAYADYKEVSGMKIPFKVIQQLGSNKVELEVTAVEINKEIPDSIFEVK